MPREISKKKIFISLYFMIPLIFAGLSMLAVILSCKIAHYYENINQLSAEKFFIIVLLAGVITFFISFIILRLILKPVMKFVRKTQTMPLFSDSQTDETLSITDDIDQIADVFQKVSNLLSNVEARELFPEIIGSSAVLRNIFSQIIKIAPTDSTVMILGESGTGKELIAEAIYAKSLRKGRPFIKINCVAIPEGLLESELFGHEKGSFTGAIAQKKGKFELANGGTIFLDEIGDMPPVTQAKLLRALQEKEFERVGGITPIKVDVRFIVATNKNLPEMIKAGTFREDLYFRVNVFSIYLPPLRERGEDISMLANYFLNKSAREVKLSSSTLQILIGYSWPGNIRELKNVIEQAGVLCENGVIEPRHLPDAVLKQSLMPAINNLNDNITLDEKIALMEREIIINALKKTNGVQVKAATILGINQRSLWHRIKKLNIDAGNFK